MALIVLALIAVLLVVATGVQVVLPRVAERRIRERLAVNGGVAAVRIRAFPATRLLGNAGDLIEVQGSDLVIGLAPGRTPAEEPPPPARGRPGLSALDGFADVDIELVDFRTGPFEVAAFVLERSGFGSYAMAVRAHTTPAELATLGLEALPAIPGGSLIGSVAGQALGSRRIPISLQIELISEPSGLRVGAGGGSIGGYPAGPLATTIAAAVARRLEIVP